MLSPQGTLFAPALLGLAAVLAVSGCAEEEEAEPAEVDESADVTVPRHPVIRTIAGLNSDGGGFADGDATAARFDWPEGLAIDRAGTNLYIADTRNHAIRKLDLTTMQVTTIAGVGGEAGAADGDTDEPARLDTPRNLLLDASEANLYFTDTGNFVIRKLDLASGVVTTELGEMGQPGSTDGVGTAARFGSGKYNPWSGGLALYGAPGEAKTTMFVADSANQTIRKVDLETREVTTIAGQPGAPGRSSAGHADGPGLEALFNKPAGLAVVGDELYVAEANNLTIRAIDLRSGEVRTVAGAAPADPTHYCENISPALPPECGANDSDIGTEARFRFPFGLTVGARSDLFVVDSHNNLIRRFRTETTAVSTVAGVQETVLDDIPHPSSDSTDETPGTFWHPTHAVFRPPSTLYVSDRSAQCIREVELLAD